MPQNTDINSILILGAGPIVIGQACEFDYSGTQACKALRENGFKVILVNSNPATIMTDPHMADVTYIEPIHHSTVSEIIKKERPDAILPTMGGQTALNCALDLDRLGILDKYNVTMIGATKQAIDKAEDREKFGKAMKKIGLKTPPSGLAHCMKDAWKILDEIGYPAIIRPSFTMGGSGGGIAYNREEFIEICQRGLELSPTSELLIDKSILGWKEYELEVIRDSSDNVIIVCSIENVDPMGVHTGDSITVAPAQTLTDKEYQLMRDAAIKVVREIGVDTGGANVQFAVNPQNGDMVVIEMNPRVSRSSALASKATGFPIAKVAALLAVGYTLDELKNDITDGKTPASFEPTIDYVVTKIPRFDFEKFPEANDRLTTQMKSVGEVMAFGRNFNESLQKAICGLEIGFNGLCSVLSKKHDQTEKIMRELRMPGAKRLWYVADAFRQGLGLQQVHQLCLIDPWFLQHIQHLIHCENELSCMSLEQLTQDDMFYLKQQGFSDSRLAELLQKQQADIYQLRKQWQITPVYKHVDSCAAEFKTNTSYCYATYESANEVLMHQTDDLKSSAKRNQKEKIIVLGGGPNRIGQGIEFDYCCVHAVLGMKELGYETIMINCNPETVSTDYDISDKLYFEPVTFERVMNIVELEQPLGVIVQFGGQTPLKLAMQLEQAGVPILGTSPQAIAQAEDRESFQALLNKLELQQPPNGTVRSVDEGKRLAKVLAYPLVVRPSYVLGGRDMKIIYNQAEFLHYMNHVTNVSEQEPLLLDHFLENAIEVDVDAVCDGEQVLIGGILEHIEQAGIHSGDSSCTLPPHSLSKELQQQITEQITQIALHLGVSGLINAQFAIQHDQIYVLEVNPRASRTIPFIAKATGLPLAKLAAQVMTGRSIASLHNQSAAELNYFAVKRPVFPFAKFPQFDPRLGPEMLSTGEAMGLAQDFGHAFNKASIGSNQSLPTQGTAFLSVHNSEKDQLIAVAQQLIEQGFELVATTGTAQFLKNNHIECKTVNKVSEGRPHIVDMIKNGEIHFIINVSKGKMAASNSRTIRQSAIAHRVCYNTTLAGGRAAALAIGCEKYSDIMSLQQLHQEC